MHQQFSPNEFIRHLQALDVPIRNTMAFVADRDFTIRRDISQLKSKFDLPLTNHNSQATSPVNKLYRPNNFQNSSGNKQTHPSNKSKHVHFNLNSHTLTNKQENRNTLEIPEEIDIIINQLRSELIRYQQQNELLKLSLSDKDGSAQQVIDKLQRDLAALRLEYDRTRSWQQRTIKQQNDSKKSPTSAVGTSCLKCAQFQLRINALQQRLQKDKEKYQRDLKSKDQQLQKSEISKLEMIEKIQRIQQQLKQTQQQMRIKQKQNTELLKKLSKSKDRDVRNEYNQLMQSYNTLNTDNERILLQFDRATQKQMQQEHQLNEITTRLEDINIHLQGYGDSSVLEKDNHEEWQSIVTELENKIQGLHTRFTEKSIEFNQIEAKLIEKDDRFRRLSDEYSEAIEKIDRYQEEQSLYRQKIYQLQKQIQKMNMTPVTKNTANQELLLQNQRITQQLKQQTANNYRLASELTHRVQQITNLHQKLQQAESYIKSTVQQTLEQKDSTIRQLIAQNQNLDSRIKDLMFMSESHREEPQQEVLSPSTIKIELLEAEVEDMRNKVYEYERLIAQLQKQHQPHTLNNQQQINKQDGNYTFELQRHEKHNLERQLDSARKKIQELEYDYNQEQLRSQRVSREYESAFSNLKNDNHTLIYQNQQIKDHLQRAETFIEQQTQREKALVQQLDQTSIAHIQVLAQLTRQHQHLQRQISQLQKDRQKHLEEINQISKNYDRVMRDLQMASQQIHSLKQANTLLVGNQASLQVWKANLSQSLQNQKIQNQQKQQQLKQNYREIQAKMSELLQQNQQLKSIIKDRQMQEEQRATYSAFSLNLSQSLKIGESIKLGHRDISKNNDADKPATSSSAIKNKGDEEQLELLKHRIKQLQRNNDDLHKQINDFKKQIQSNDQIVQHSGSLIDQINKLSQSNLQLTQKLSFLQQYSQHMQRQNKNLLQELNRNGNITALAQECDQKLAQMDVYIRNQEIRFREQLQSLDRQKNQERKSHEQAASQWQQRQLQIAEEANFYRQKLAEAEKYIAQLLTDKDKLTVQLSAVSNKPEHYKDQLEQQLAASIIERQREQLISQKKQLENDLIKIKRVKDQLAVQNDKLKREMQDNLQIIQENDSLKQRILNLNQALQQEVEKREQYAKNIDQHPLSLQHLQNHNKTLELQLIQSQQHQNQAKIQAQFFKNKLEQAEAYLMQLQSGRIPAPIEANVTDFLLISENQALKQQIEKLKRQNTQVQQKYSRIALGLQQTIADLNAKIVQLKKQIPQDTSSSPSILTKIRQLQQHIDTVTKDTGYFKSKLKQAQQFIDKLEKSKRSSAQNTQNQHSTSNQITKEEIQILNLRADAFQFDIKIKESAQEIRRQKQYSKTLEQQLAEAQSKLNNTIENDQIAKIQANQTIDRLKEASQQIIFLKNKLFQAEDYIFYLEKDNKVKQQTLVSSIDVSLFEGLKIQNDILKNHLIAKDSQIEQLKQKEIQSETKLHQNNELINRLVLNSDEYMRKVNELEIIIQKDKINKNTQTELEQLKNDYDLIQKIWNADRQRLDQMQAYLITIEADKKQSEQKLYHAQNNLEKLELQHDSLKKKLLQTEIYINEMQSEKQKLLRGSQSPRKKGQSFSCEYCEFNNQAAQALTEIVFFKDKVKEDEQYIGRLLSEKAKIQQQSKETITQLQQRIRQMNQQRAYIYDSWQLTKNELTKQIKQLQFKNAQMLVQLQQKVVQKDIGSDLRKQKQTFEQLIREKEDIIQNIQRSLKNKGSRIYTNDSIEFLKSKLQEAQDYIAQMQEENTQVTQAIQFLQQTSLKLNQEIAKLNQKLIISDGEKDMLMTDNLQMQSEIQELKFKNQKLDERINQLKLSLQKQVQLAKNQRQETKFKLQLAESQQAERKTLVDSHLNRIQILQNKIQQLQGQIYEKDNEKALLKQQQRAAYLKIDNVTVELDFFKQKLKQAEDYIGQIEKTRQQQQQELEAQNMQITEQASKLIEVLKKQVSELQKANERLQQKNMAVSQINRSNDLTIKQLEQSIAAVNQKVQKFQTEINQLKKSQSISQQKMQQSYSLADELKRSLIIKQNQIEKEVKEIQFFKAKLLQAQQYISSLQKQNEDLKLHISSLGQNISSLSSEVANLNDQLVKSDRNSIQLLSQIEEKSYQNQALRKQIFNLSDSRRTLNNQQISSLKEANEQLERLLVQQKWNHKNNIEQLSNSLNETQGLKQQIQMDKVLAEQQLAKLQVQLQTIRKRVGIANLPTIVEQETEETAQFFKNKLHEAQSHIEELQKQNDTFRIAIQPLQQNVDLLGAQVARLNDKLITTDLDYKLLLKEIEKLKDQNENKQTIIDSQQKTLEKLQFELQQRSIDVSKEQSETLSKLQEQKDKREREEQLHTDLMNLLQQLQNQNRHLAEQNAQHVSKAKQLQDIIAQLRNQLIIVKSDRREENIDYLLSQESLPKNADVSVGQDQDQSELYQSKLIEAQRQIYELNQQKQKATNAFDLLLKQTQILREQISLLKQKALAFDIDKISLLKEVEQMKNINQQLSQKLQSQKLEHLSLVEAAVKDKNQLQLTTKELQTQKTKQLQLRQNHQNKIKYYETIRNDLQGKLLDAESSQLKLQKDINILKKQKQKLQDNLQQTITKAQAKDQSSQYNFSSQIQNYSDKIAKLEEERLNIISQNQELKNSVNMLISEVIDLKQHSNRLEILNEALKPEIDSLKNDKQLMESDIAKLNSKLVYLESLQQIKDKQIQELKNLIEISKDVQKSQQAKVSSDILSHEIDQRPEATKVQQNTQDKSKLLSQKQAQIQLLMQQLQKLQEQNRQSKVQNLNLQEQIRQLLSSSQTAIDKHTIQQLKQRLDDIERINIELQAQTKKALQDKKQAESQVIRLKQQEKLKGIKSNVIRKNSSQNENIQENVIPIEIQQLLKQMEQKQRYIDQIAIDNQRMSWKIRELEEKKIEDDAQRADLISKFKKATQKLAQMVLTQEKLQRQSQQLYQDKEILQQSLEHSKQRINQLEESVEKQRKIEESIRKIIDITNYFSQSVNEEDLLPNLEPYPCLKDLVHTVLYKLRLSSALTRQKQLKMLQLGKQVQQLSKVVQSMQYMQMQDASRRAILQELAKYEQLNKDLEERLQAVTLDFNFQGEILRDYQRQIEQLKYQLNQQSQQSIERIAAKIQQPIDSSTSMNTKDMAYLQFVTTCLDKIIDLQQAVNQIKKDIIQVTQLEGLSLTQRSSDNSSGSNLVIRLQELQDRLINRQQTHILQESNYLDLKLTDLLKKITLNMQLPSTIRSQIDKYLTYLQAQIAKAHELNSEQQDKQFKIEEVILNQEGQHRNPNDLLREITGLNHAVQIYHIQSLERRKRYKSTIEGLILVLEELKQDYVQLSHQKSHQPINQVCYSIDQLGKLMKNALQSMQQDEISSQLELDTGNDSILSGNYTQMAEVNRQRKGRPAFDSSAHLEENVREIIQNKLQSRDVQTDDLILQIHTYDKAAQKIQQSRRRYYEANTLLSDQICSHLTQILTCTLDGQRDTSIDSLFRVLHSIEQSFQASLIKKDRAYHVHTQKMNLILNSSPEQQSEEMMIRLEQLKLENQRQLEDQGQSHVRSSHSAEDL